MLVNRVAELRELPHDLSGSIEVSSSQPARKGEGKDAAVKVVGNAAEAVTADVASGEGEGVAEPQPTADAAADVSSQ